MESENQKLKDEENLDFEKEEVVNEAIKDELEKAKEDENYTEDLEEIEDRYEKPKNKKSKKIILVLAVVLALILVAFIAMNSYYKSKIPNDKIAKNIYFNGINLENKTKEEAIKLLEDEYKKDYDNNRNIDLKKEDEEKARKIIKEQIKKGLIKEEVETEEGKKVKVEEEQFKNLRHYNVSPKIFEFEINKEKIADKAFNIGRNKNMKEIKKILKGEKIEINSEEEFKSINEESLKEFLAEISNTMPGKPVDNVYAVNGDKLIITKGIEGIDIDEEDFKKQIIEIFEKREKLKDNKILLNVKSKKNEEINIEKIYKEVKKDVKDAKFNEKDKRIEKEQIGIDFAISMDEAKKILSEDKEEYIIPLKLTKPKVTTEAFLTRAFPDVLANYTSFAPSCGALRAVNLAVGSSYINGTIVNPGEVFSFNRAVGPISVARGFKQGGAFSASGIRYEIGGGICQVVSTVYNAALLSGMEIVERHQHMYQVDYVPAGRDATMYQPSLDFKFKNVYSRPIKIVASGNGGRVNVKILGIDQGIKGEVSVSVNSVIPRPTKRINDPNLPAGKQVRSGTGFDGAKTTTYYKLYKNGKVVKSSAIHSDYYKPIGRATVRVGTGSNQKSSSKPKANPKPQPKPQQKPEPKPEQPKPEEESKE